MEEREAIIVAQRKKKRAYSAKWWGDVISVEYVSADSATPPNMPPADEGYWLVRFAWVGKITNTRSQTDDGSHGHSLTLQVGDLSGCCRRVRSI